MLRYLIVHQGALGDIIIAVHSLLELKKKACLDIFCKDDIGIFLKHYKIVEKYFSISSKKILPLFSNKPDLNNDLLYYDKIIIFSFSSCINDLKKNFDNKIIVIPPRPNPLKRIHVSDYILDELKKNGLIDNKALINKQESAFPIEKDIQLSKKIVIHPGSGSVKKNWPLKSFIELYNLLVEKNYDVHFILGICESQYKDHLLNIPETNIKVFTDIIEIINFIKCAKIFIGNDSGLSHLAALINIPVFVIFGPSDYKRWTPIGNSVHVIKTEFECSPCFEQKNIKCKELKCLDSISSLQVYKKLYL